MIPAVPPFPPFTYSFWKSYTKDKMCSYSGKLERTPETPEACNYGDSLDQLQAAMPSDGYRNPETRPTNPLNPQANSETIQQNHTCNYYYAQLIKY
jgi:hypothetical protein